MTNEEERIQLLDGQIEVTLNIIKVEDAIISIYSEHFERGFMSLLKDIDYRISTRVNCVLLRYSYPHGSYLLVKSKSTKQSTE